MRVTKKTTDTRSIIDSLQSGINKHKNSHKYWKLFATHSMTHKICNIPEKV